MSGLSFQVILNFLKKKFSIYILYSMIFKQLNFQNLPVIDEKSDTVVSLNVKIEKSS